MKSMEEVAQLLARRAPSDPVVSLLNEAFGHLGWEYDGSLLTVNTRVSEGSFFAVRRSGKTLKDAAANFGLEIEHEQPKTPTPEASAESPVQAPLQPGPSRKVIEESISAASQIILAKKLKTQDELVAMLQAYGVKAKSQLSDEQAVELMEKLKSLTKEK